MNKYQIKQTKVLETYTNIQALTLEDAEAKYHALVEDGTMALLELTQWNVEQESHEINLIVTRNVEEPFSPRDYVLYERSRNTLAKDSMGLIIVYGDRYEAEAECRENELIIACNDLPSDLKSELLNQINNA
jgi:hypothetical protein